MIAGGFDYLLKVRTGDITAGHSADRRWT